MSPATDVMRPSSPHARQKPRPSGGASAKPVTSLPRESSQAESHPPLKPVCPVTKTRLPFQKAPTYRPSHPAQGAEPERQRSFRSSMSRKVSMHCQKPWCW